MPNFDNKNDNQQASRFYGFVMTYYRNDPYLMLDKFSSQIADVAAEVSIDWYQTRGAVTLDGTFVKGRAVVGLEKADSGRISVIAFENKHSWTSGNESYTVHFPSIRFKNFRKHYPEPVVFDGYKALKEEFDSYISGTRVSRVKSDSDRQQQYLVAAKKRQQEEEEAKASALAKDEKWISQLKRLDSPCDYFSRKGIPDLHQWVTLYAGHTSLGMAVGDFTGLKLCDVDTLKFRGMQRIYPAINRKLFRRGIDPSGAAFIVPERKPINGEVIYLLEAPADAGMCYKLTGCFSVAAMFADNIQAVALILRRLCPDSPLIFVADNDQYGAGPNKGVEVCELALRNTPGKAHMLIPDFDENGRLQHLKDLTDYTGMYGEEAAKAFLLSYGG